MMRMTMIALTLIATPAAGEVTQSDPAGFVSTHRLTIAAPPDKVWDTIARPSLWWSKDHTYSGDSANIAWDTRAGGCWCEKLEGGAVEHGRTVYAVRGRALRVSGAFGPLQSGAVNATLTFALKAAGSGTELTVTYVVGGFHPMGLANLAAPVDGVIGAQMAGLKRTAEAAN